jgi:sucrose-6-phosphate hydrolase SacC (GH32 family)
VTREVTADKRWMLLPVKNGAKTCKMEVRSGAEVLRFFDIELARASQTGGRRSMRALARPAADAVGQQIAGGVKGLGKCPVRRRGLPESGPLPRSPAPRIHFSPARGWNNDPNGLVFYNGEYHLFSSTTRTGELGQHALGACGQQGSVHWTEVGEALYPDELGPMYSGSAVVDHANTSGFGKDGKAPLVLIYTAAGNPATQCIAHSLDGRTFTKYAGNPVVKNITGGNRDPKVFWHAPTRRWVMTLYVGYTGKRHTIELLASSNLREWTRLSTVEGDTGGGHYLYECPDLFELAVAGSSDKQWILFGADAQYAVGTFDGTVFTPAAERLRGHRGSIYYAAQTFDNAPNARRILIPWLRAPSPGMPFNQCLGLPQELGLARTSEGVRLTRRPVAELAALRERTAAFGPLAAAPGKPGR